MLNRPFLLTPPPVQTPPIGYRKVTKEDALSDSEEEEEVYVKGEEPGEKGEGRGSRRKERYRSGWRRCVCVHEP